MNVLKNTKSCLQFLLITLVGAGFTAVLLAGVTVSVAEANTSIYGPESATVSTSTPYESGSIDATQYQNLVFSFEYEDSALDDGDTFSYGYKLNGTSTTLDTVEGEDGDGTSTEAVSKNLPSSTQVSDLKLFAEVDANTDTDKVVLTDITLTGKTADNLEPEVCEEGDKSPETDLDVTNFSPKNGDIRIENTSEENCSYDVGLAAYKGFATTSDDKLKIQDPNGQDLDVSDTTTLAPGEDTTLSVTVPSCAYQIDAFYGDLIEDFGDGGLYGDRKLDVDDRYKHNQAYSHENTDNLCGDKQPKEDLKTCPFTEKSNGGDYDRVVEFEDVLSKGWLGANGPAQSSEKSLNPSLDSGTYHLAMFGWDDSRGGNHDRSTQNQPIEKWYLRFSNDSGYTANSSSTDDLQDETQFATNTTQTTIQLTQDANKIQARHHAHKVSGAYSANSLVPECVGINEKEREPEPEVLSCTPDELYHLKTEVDEGSELVSIDKMSGTQSSPLGVYDEKFTNLAVGPNKVFYALAGASGAKELATLNDDGSTNPQATVSGLGKVVAMGYAPDGTLYVGVQSNPNADKFFEVNTSTGTTTQLSAGNTPKVSGGDLAVNRDGDIVYVNGDGEVHIFDGSSWQTLSPKLDGNSYSSLAYTSDGKYHAYDRENNEIDTFEITNGGVNQLDNAPDTDVQYGDGASCLPELSSLNLTKLVDNNDNPEDGSATSSDFILEVRNASGTVVATTTGSTTAQTIDLPAGDYSITESTVGDIDSGDYTASFSPECSQGSIYLEQGQDASCTVTNTEGKPLGERCTPGKQYADEVVSADQGVNKDGDEIPNDRSDPQAMLGDPDGDFWSIGKNGSTTVRFDEYIIDQDEKHDGGDISIHEITGGDRASYVNETVVVEVSKNGSDWHSLGEVSSQQAAVTYLDIASTGLSYVQYVRLTDTTDYSQYDGNPSDGFDIDAIDGVEGECDKPIPEIPQCETADQRWADNVVSYEPGDAHGGDTIANNRDNPSEATGPDGPSDDAIDFVSLGFGGELVLGFDEAIPDKTGDDLRIYETTYGQESTSTYPETAKVYGSQTGTSTGDFALLGSVTIDEGSGHVSTVDIDGSGLSEVRFIKIEDTSTESDFDNKGGERDGFDVAGVEGLTCGDGEISQCQADILHMDTGLAGNDDQGELFTVDSSTGSTTLELDYDTPFFAVLTSENNGGDLFSIREDTDQLVTLEDNEQMTNVGETMGLDKPVAMDFVAGTLYVLDQETDELHTLDPSDGNTSNKGNLQESGNATNNLDVEGGDLTDPRDGSDTIIYVREDGEVFRIDPSSTSYESLGAVNSPEHITSAVKKGDTYYAMDREATNNDQDGTLYTFELDGDDIENVQTTSETGPYQYGDGTCGTAPENNDDGDTGTISGVKYSDDNGNGDRDADEEGIGDFRILAFENDPIADFEVEADDSDGVTPTTTFATSSTYIVEVSGTYRFSEDGGPGSYTDFADAEYYTESGNFASDRQASTSDPSRDPAVLDLVTSQNSNPDWGPFRSNHTYRQITSGSDMPVNFRIADSNYSDNAGSLDVRIYEVTKMDVKTNPDGTYQFSNVPEGDYTVLEVNQPNAYRQTEPADGTCNVEVDAGETSECDFGNEPLGDDDQEGGDDGDGSDDNDDDGDGSDGGSSGGGGGGGVLESGDGGSVLGDEDDADNGNDDEGDNESTPTGERDLQEMLDEARKKAQNLLKTLEERERVAGAQTSPGIPAGGDGSLQEPKRLAQAGDTAGESNATSTDDAVGTTSTTTDDEAETEAAGTEDGMATAPSATTDDSFNWGFWIALIGFLIVAGLLWRDYGNGGSNKTASTTSGTDDPAASAGTSTNSANSNNTS